MTDSTGLPSPERLAYLISGDQLAEDDIGVWEVVWSLNSSHPDVSLDDEIRLARRAVTLLLGSQAELWLGDPQDESSRPLTNAETQALAFDDLAWYDPDRTSLVVWLRSST